MKTPLKSIVLTITVFILSGQVQCLWAQSTVKVNVENYVRAERDYQIKTYAETNGAFGKLVHQLNFYSVDHPLTV